MRKTIDVEAFVDFANHVLLTCTGDTEFRRGICAAVDHVLHETGNYVGFRLLNKNDLGPNIAPGVLIGDDGFILPYPERFNGCDDTRRQYGCKTTKGRKAA